MDGKKRVLAIDLGASSGRGIVFETDGAHLTYREVHRFANGAVDRDGALMWDINMLHASIVECIRQCAKSHIHIDSIGIDTWGVDYGVIDSTGAITAYPYSYRDSRTEGAIEREDILTKRELYDMAGIALGEFNTEYQLMAETRHIGSDDTILYMPYLLGYLLTGERGSDVTFASTTGFFDGERYSRRYLDAVGLAESNFADILAVGAVLGKVKREILADVGIDYDIDVRVVCGHDTASAIMTVMDGEKSPLYLSSGTWSLFGTLTREPIINDITYGENYTNERGFGGVVTLLKNIMGMWIVQECKREWSASGAGLGWQDIQDSARVVEPFAGFINVGDDIFGAPGDMPQRIRDYVNRTQGVELGSVGEIARCVYESLALEYRYALEGLKRITGEEYDTLHIIGGGVQNDLLNSLVADCLGVRVIGGAVEATAIGNGLAQLYGMGVVTTLGDMYALAEQCYTRREYVPNSDRESWDEAYARYLELKR